MPTSPRQRRRRWLRPVSLVTALVFLTVNVGCAVWRTKSVAGETELLDLKGKTVRFHVSDPVARVVEMVVREVEYPMVRGWPNARKRKVTQEVDLREVSVIEVYEISGWRTALLAAGLTGVVVAIAIANSGGDSDRPPPTNTTSGTGGSGSCPIVYVEREQGSQLVGDTYAGAIFRSIQRTDLLPLPALSGHRSSLVLADEARETQYTDFLELVVADHPPGTRAVSTVDQEVALVGDAVPAIHAVDFRGAEVTEQIANADGVRWQTDFPGLLEEATPPLTDGLVATFARPDPTERPVLELVLVNSYWLNRSVAEFFAMMGPEFDGYLERGNQPTARPMVEWWANREGVALDVAWRHGDTWEEVARVAPVGQVALRRVAVPLPEQLAHTDAETLTIRVSSGTGFWEVDQVALSVGREGPLETHHLAPALARNDRDEDGRAALAAIDDRYQTLETVGEYLRVDFELPPLPPDRVRSAFLFSRGYYNLHPPVGGTRSFGDIESIRAKPGGLSRLALELYRTYAEIAAATPMCRVVSHGGT